MDPLATIDGTDASFRRGLQDRLRRTALHGTLHDAERDSARSDTIAYLERLRPLLAKRGFSTWIHDEVGEPLSLRVFRPEAPEVQGYVHAECSTTGIELEDAIDPVDTWFYWWIWGRRIGPASRLVEAVEAITRFLTSGE